MNKISGLLCCTALACAVSLSSCKSGNSADGGSISTDTVENPTQITFDQDTYEFGDIIQGEKVSHDFSFTNTGKHDLVISAAHPSCGCTVADFPKEPIKPGESGVIKVVFNSAGKSNKQMKVIYVVANTVPSETKIYLKGNVVVPEDKTK